MKLKPLFVWIVFLMYLFYSLNYSIFERVLYFNELLSLIGVLCFFTYYIKGVKVIIPKFIIFKCVFYFQILFIIYAIASFPERTNNYYYFRHFSIFYSTFIFFIGFLFYKEFIAIFVKIYKLLYMFLLVNIPFRLGVYGLGRYTGPLFLALLTKNMKKRGLLILSLIIIIYAIIHQEDTALVFSLFLVYIHFFRTYKTFKILITFATFSFVFFFIYFNDYIILYKTGDYRLFGNIEALKAAHPIFTLDSNTTWRIMLWHTHLIEQFPENIMGIGIGNSVYPYMENVETAWSRANSSDEYNAHLTGAHNSLITVFTRFGIIGFLLIFIPIKTVFKYYFNRNKYILKNKLQPFFIAFFFIFFIALLNPGLMSPKYSGNYWMLLGIVSGIIYNDKRTIINVKKSD